MPSPTIRRRRLSAELIQLREDAGFTIAQAAERLDWSRARLTYMETNRWSRPDLGNIRALLDLYGVTDEREREKIITLAKESRLRGWWAAYGDVFQGPLPGFEDGAALIRTYETVLIPGLLQTEAYAREIFRGGRVLDDDAVNRRIRARLARQDILARDTPPVLWAVVDEAALRKMVGGPDVMAEQLRHLAEMSRRANVTVQVMPDSVGAHAAMLGSFVILDFPDADDPSVVYKEGVTERLYLERREEVQEYTMVFEGVVASSMPPEESSKYLMSLVDRLIEARNDGSN